LVEIKEYMRLHLKRNKNVLPSFLTPLGVLIVVFLIRD
jgi:hypothetical protein